MTRGRGRAAAAALLSTLMPLLLATPGEALRPEDLSFDLRVGDQQCFRQTFPPRTHVQGEVLIVDGDPGITVTFVVTDVADNKLLFHRDGAAHETFSLNAPADPTSGEAARGPRHLSEGEVRDHKPVEYKVCLIAKRPTGWVRAQDHSREPATRRIFVNLREADGEDRVTGQADLLNRLTRTKDLEGVGRTIDVVATQVSRLSRELGELRRREALLSQSAVRTADRIVRFSVLACGAIVTAGVFSSALLQSVLRKSAPKGLA
jgi:emp24/gp25L/p24 family/GOLD